MSNEQNQNQNTFPELSWKEADIIDSLNALYKYVIRETYSAIHWYDKKRRGKKVWGYSLRVGAIVATGAAGIIPVLSQIAGEFNPLWATIAIAIAAILLVLDRFAGFTSGWVRYMITQIELGKVLETFYFNWENNRLTYAGIDPTPEQVKGSLSLCKEFMLNIREIVKNETNLWATEFQMALKEIEKAAAATTQVKQQ